MSTYSTRKGLALIEANAETILSNQGGVPRRPRPLEIWRGAGAEVTGRTGPHPQGLLPQADPGPCAEQFTHQARNPARSTIIGGRRTVFAPTARPSCAASTRGRRYGTIEDFYNFAKLTQASPLLHQLGDRDGRAGRPAGAQAAP